MASATEKIDVQIDIHDDGKSTKVSDQTSTTKDSEPAMDNGKRSRNRKRKV